MSARTARRFAHKGFVKIGEETYPCKFFNMSMTGATLIFDGPIDLPDNFTIQLTPDGKVSRTCSLSWSEGNQFGVLFAASR